MTLVHDAAQRSRSDDFTFEALVTALPKKQRAPLCASLLKQVRDRPVDPPQTASRRRSVASLNDASAPKPSTRIWLSQRQLFGGQVTLGVGILHGPPPVEGATTGNAEPENHGSEVRTTPGSMSDV